MSVSIGCEALIGAAIVMGKCLVAKYAKSHEDSTMQALMKSCFRKLQKLSRLKVVQSLMFSRSLMIRISIKD